MAVTFMETGGRRAMPADITNAAVRAVVRDLGYSQV